MSRKAQILDKMYKQGKVTIDGLRQAVEDGVITEAEFEEITGENF